MPLRSAATEGWKVNRINIGPPYAVRLVGPWRLPQVVDRGGTVALSGPGGAVFCASEDQANTLLAKLAAGELERS